MQPLPYYLQKFANDRNDIKAAELNEKAQEAGIKVIGVGSTIVRVRHPDIPSSPVTIPVIGFYGTTAVVVTPAAFTGTTTGQTQQLTVVNQNGYDVTAQCTFVSYYPNIFTVNATGLVTCVGNIGDGYITATHIYTGVYAHPTTIWRFQP